MRRFIGGSLFTAVLGLLLCDRAAFAQESAGNIPHVTDQLRVSAGAMFSGSDLRDEGGDVWFLANVTYDLRPPSPSRFLQFSAYFDGAFHSSNYDIDKLRFDTAYHVTTRTFFGLGIQARALLTPSTHRFSFYGTGGIGVYRLGKNDYDTYKFDDTGYYDSDGNYVDSDAGVTRNSVTRSKYNLGYKFGVGIGFGRGLFVEGNYLHVGKLDDIRYSGFALTIGARL